MTASHNDLPDRFETLHAFLGQLKDVPPPRADPIKLTREQLDQLRAECPPSPYPNPAASLTGIAIVLVDSIRESTPYAEGWITCPWCQAPMVDHPSGGCTATVVDQHPCLPAGVQLAWKDTPTRPVGEFDGFYRGQARLFTEPGLTADLLERVRDGILRMAAEVDPLTPGTDNEVRTDD